MAASGNKRRPTSKYRLPSGFSEIGYSGLRHNLGIIDEEFLYELKGTQGVKTYREMMSNDSGIGAILFAVNMLIRQAKRNIHPFDEKNEQDKKTAEFVDSCFDDMSYSWQDTLTEVLTMLPYGWAFLEIVYKKRNGLDPLNPGISSNHDDGLIGWRKLPLRAQSTLDRWIISDSGGIMGMIQRRDGKPPAPIPLQRALLFRTESTRNNPEGRSILRTSYRDWYFKKRIQEIEGIGVERDLAGLPMLTPAEGHNIWDTTNPAMVAMKNEAEKIVRNIRRDEQEGIVKPFGWEFELVSTGGQRNFDTSKIIDRYNTGIAMTVLADFIVLGHNNRYGSFALAGSKTHMFGLAVMGWLAAIETVFNKHAIPRLLAINGMDVTRLPKMGFSDVEIPNLDELGKFIANLAKAGFKMFPNIPLEKKLLSLGGLPTEGLLLGQEQIVVEPTDEEGEDDDAPPKGGADDESE